jgi:hypothetical protein
MARNEYIVAMMMTSILTGSNPSTLQVPHSSLAQPIIPDHHGSLEEGGLAHYEVH